MENQRTTILEQFKLHNSIKIAEYKETYVYDIVSNSEFEAAASLSDCNIKVVDLIKFTPKYTWKAHNNQISGLKYSPINEQHLISSSWDGSIKLWDLRQALDKPSQSFTGNSEKIKPLTCFDIDFKGSYLCGGTELVHLDSYILFWDIRKSELLGGYWESHFDDLTQVKFHPSCQNWIITSSLDGLINLFDITKTNEEDALVTTLNTESGIFKLNWIIDCKKKLSCITYDHGLQIWNLKEPLPQFTIKKEELFHYQNDIQCCADYIIDFTRTDSTCVEFMSGKYEGSQRIWNISEGNCNLVSDLISDCTDVIRSCFWNNKYNTVVTGGENGVIFSWRKENDDNDNIKNEDEIKRNIDKLSINKEDAISSDNETKNEVSVNNGTDTFEKENEDKCSSDSTKEVPSMKTNHHPARYKPY